MVDADDFEAHAKRVIDDHYLHIGALLAAGAYAWQLHGFWVALALIVSAWVIISVTNIALLAATGSLRALRISRWAWLAILWVGLLLSGASFVGQR